MAIQSAGRGHNTHLIKITLGYEQGTRKRLYYTETFKGTKKDARLREAELKLKLRGKKLVLTSKMTFSACLDHYCEEAQPRLSITCFYIYESFIRRYLMPALGFKKLKELGREDFQEVYNALRLSPRTIHTLHGAARAVITWAMNKSLFREDILKGIKLPKIPKARPEFLTYEEMQTFFDAAPNYWYGNAFKFQFMTGVRNQELMALKWDDVDFDAATVLVRRACIWADTFRGFKSTKTAEERAVELDEQTIDLLRRVRASQEAHIRSRISNGLSYNDTNLIFCARDGHVPRRTTVGRCLKLILKKIGITRRFRWYGIRHTHATLLLDSDGAKPKVIANRMGHSVETLFRVYVHEMKGQQREALSKISSRVTLCKQAHQPTGGLRSSLAKQRGDELTDEQWAVIGPLIPEPPRRENGRGRLWRSTREVINGILWVLRTAANWQDLPKRFPPDQTCYQCFLRWSRDGTLRVLLETLARDLEERGQVDLSECFIDGTFLVAKKDGALWAPSRAKGRSSWEWQTFMVFLSPSTQRLLRRMKSPLSKRLLCRVSPVAGYAGA